MQRYLVARMAQAVLSVFLITSGIFFLARLTGDPTYLMVFPLASEEDVAVMRHELGFDQALHVQYLVFLSRAVRGDLGQSLKWGGPSLGVVLERFPATLELTLAASVLSLLIGLPTGVLSAVKRDSILDDFGKTFALFGQSVLTFWLGIVLIWIFAVILRLLPTSGRGGAEYLLLPAITLGWYMAAGIMRLTRSAMLDVLQCDYISVARAKGLAEWVVINRHALKNASIPVLTFFGLQLAALLRGTVIVETVFAWPGVGRLAVDAVLARDFPVVQAAVLLMSTAFVLINVLVDMIYAALDPRIRYR